MINEDRALEALTELLNALESGISSARRIIGQATVNATWNPKKITWTQAEGDKGPYERADKQDGEDFRVLLQNLQRTGGFLTKGGYTYWKFSNKEAIGRKLKKSQRNAPPQIPEHISKVQGAFPQDLAGMLHFEEADGYVLVKPTVYLGSDNFRRIAAVVRNQLAGEYVSAGRDSHFRIPIEELKK